MLNSGSRARDDRMRYRRPSRLRRVATLRVAMIGILTLNCTGCVIPLPLAIYPKKCVASGETIAFHDQDGKLIEKDGLLLIQRLYHYGFGCDSWLDKTSDDVVKIERGKARVPPQTVIAAFCTRPIPFKFFPTPLFFEMPGDGINFVPLIYGYDDGSHVESFLRGSGDAPLFGFHHNWDGAAREYTTEYMSTTHDHFSAVLYYRFVLDHLRREADKKLREHQGYFYLPDSDYLRVKKFLEIHLEQLQRGVSPKCPSCGYNLTGNGSGKCPECGTKIPSTLPAPSG